jgi:putative ABC transport system substrate-binding protein
MPSIQAAASSFAVEVSAAPVHAKDEIEGVIAAQAYDPGGGLIVMPDVFNDGNRELIIALAARHRIPAIYAWREAAAAGGLMSYGASFTDAYRQAGIYAGRILKGEKPGDLPVMLPTKFELVLNLKTAKALGLTVPDRLLALANEVIE